MTGDSEDDGDEASPPGDDDGREGDDTVGESPKPSEESSTRSGDVATTSDSATAQSRDGATRAADVDEERIADLEAELEALREDLSAFESHVDERTLHREEIEAELEQYVRERQRRGHATGWGPYLVLLYGTVMTLGAFYYLSGGWAIAAMIVVWLSTLGLFVVMLLTGAALGAGRKLGGLIGALRRLRG